MQNNDLISRAALKNELAPQNDWSWGNGAYVRDMIDAMPTVDAEPVRQWISVKDRLPEKDGPYIVFGCSDAMKKFLPDSIPIWICDYSERNGGWYSIEMNRTIDYITHWMSLPEQPKEDNDEDVEEHD